MRFEPAHAQVQRVVRRIFRLRHQVHAAALEAAQARAAGQYTAGSLLRMRFA
jgi:hypothetical protein